MPYETYTCSPQNFLKSARLPVRVLESEADAMEEIAQNMFRLICRGAQSGRTVLICPVGPVDQYPLLADKINRARISLSHVWFINMDEYLDENGRPTSDTVLSFHHAMQTQFYSRLLPELRPPANQCLFPDPADPSAADRLLDSLGQADGVYTGVGINGHIAFNEPPEPDSDLPDSEFIRLGTRVLPISEATRVNNGGRKLHGALDIFPRQCITLGMKQLLASREIKIYLYCDWQWGVMRRIALEPPSRSCPASFLQMHPNAEMVITRPLLEVSPLCGR